MALLIRTFLDSGVFIAAYKGPAARSTPTEAVPGSMPACLHFVPGGREAESDVSDVLWMERRERATGLRPDVSLE